MIQWLIVSREDRLEEYLELAKLYNAGFEINDFFNPQLLDDIERQQAVIERYQAVGLPEGSTMHGAFLDVTVFSNDPKIRQVSELRIRQSMEIGRTLGVKGVVFHSNWNPMVYGEVYENQVVDRTVECFARMLEEYPDIEIYLENMFDSTPRILLEISRKLAVYSNYGICLDYAHANVYGTDVSEWVRELAPYVKHLHINDNNLQQDQHLAVGSGDIEWKKFRIYCQELFSDCSILIETTKLEDQKISFEYLYKLWAIPENQLRSGSTLLKPEELLERIFWYMNQLVDEKGFSSALLLLTDMGREIVHSERASFWYWDARKKQYWTLAALDSEQIIIPEGTGIVGASIQNNEIIVINEPYKDPRFNSEVDRKSGYVTRSILSIPVTNARGVVIGAFQAINKINAGGRSQFEQVDVKRLTMVAVYCGKILESHMLYHEAQVDQLTGLKNRRGFYEYYSDIVRPRLAIEKVSVIMCDIDFFKRVNDTYGHNAGDAVLVHIADILQRSVQGNGEVIRWGGEEFVLLLLERDGSQAIALAENIRETVESSVCRFGTQDIRVTMSFGVRELEETVSAEENIEQVDAKLYQAKEAGRNRVVY